QVVIQLGKWRRIVPITVTACTNNVMTTAQTHLPRNRTEGNVPRFAVSTGDVDTLECVLRKMGVEDAEFVNPSISGGHPTASGRVHVYQGGYNASNGSGGARISNQTPIENTLWGSQT